MSNETSLHRQAFIYNGAIAGKTGTLEGLITDFLLLNRGNNRPLLLRITSSGGVPEQIFGLCGIIHQVQAEGHQVQVHILGQLSGFTYMLAAVADKITMEPTASLTFAPMKVITDGTINKMKSHLAYQRKLFGMLIKAIAKRSKGKVTEADVRSWRGKHIGPDKALALGLCDEVRPMPTGPIAKGKKPEKILRVNGSFAKDDSYVFDLQIELHNWLEDDKNSGQSLKVLYTSWGGTVTQALSFYGQLCEVQRMGHHVTIQVVGQAYSCALWLPTCALGAGEVLIDPLSMHMFHQPSSALDCYIDVADDLLSIEEGIYEQTCGLLQLAKGFTPELIASWEQLPGDHYLTAEEVVELGLGKLVDADEGPTKAAQ
jgi:ATP-dependent protease ClpP protease subunit